MTNLRKKIQLVLITTILSITILNYISGLLERKVSIRKYNEYFNAQYNYDVLFVGTSHVINGIHPMEMWRDYGIVGYNFGNDSSPMAESYWTLVNALDYSKPRVVFVDCYGIANQTKAPTNFEYAHSAFDAFPFSINKIRAAMDLTNDSIRDEMIQRGELGADEHGSPLQLLWNFSVYHSRWNDLQWIDFNVDYNNTGAGAQSRVAVAIPVAMADKTSETISLDTVGFSYLDKIVEECNSRDIDLVLTYLPFPSEDNRVWKEINSLNIYSEQKNLPFINFLDDNLCDLVDFRVDMYDPMSHLNPSGAKKVSDYLGSYILTNYPNLDKRNDSNVATALNEAFDYYRGYKVSLLRDQNDLNTYLMLLNDKDFNCEISYSSEEVLKRGGGVFASNISVLGNLEIDMAESLNASSDGQVPDMWISVCYSNNGERADRVSVKGDAIIHE